MSNSTRMSRKILDRSWSALFPILLLAPLAMAPKGCDSAVIGTDCPEGAICTPGTAGAAGGIASGTAGTSNAGGAPGVGFVCKSDQECNDIPTVSSLWGQCLSDGTCSCAADRELNPATGKCRVSTGAAGATGAGGSGSANTCGGLLGLTCGKAQYCAFSLASACGSGDQTGSCQARPPQCLDNYDPVCGCDGKTYGNECTAASLGTSILKRGACEAEPGKTCGGLQGLTCAKGEFCEFAPEAQCGAADQTGTCKPALPACDANYAPVCGCDGKTYGNDCEAGRAGVSVAKPGECASADSECGGLLGKRCPTGQFCLFAPDSACGNADMTGKCSAPFEVCTADVNYVCGCDGKTYSNECEAGRAATSVLAQGKCP